MLNKQYSMEGVCSVVRRHVLALRLLGAVAALCLLAGLTGCSPGRAEASVDPAIMASNVTLTAAQRQHLQLYTVKPSSFRKTIDTTGTVDFDGDQATTVLAPMSGPVSRLVVHLGERVSEGQPLAVVASPDYATAISTYRKALATARISRRIADLDQQMFEHHALPQRDAEQAEIDAATSQADADAALQSLQSLRVDAATVKAIQDGKAVANVDGVIRSPIAGVVVEKLITPGQLLAAGSTPCFTVADLSRVWVMAHVFDSEIGSVSLGDPVEIDTGVSTQTFSGKVDNIAAQVDPDTRSVAVRVTADNPGGLLKKQMYVRVRIQAQQDSTGLLVPVSAILRDDENLPFVYLAERDGSFARRHITQGYRQAGSCEVTAGLESGDQVVTEGGLFVQFLQNQ